MNRSRRTLSLALALFVALLALTGCSGSSKSNVSAKPVELTLLMLPGQSRAAIDEVIYAYTQKHPNVRVKVKELAQMMGGGLDASALEGVDMALLTRTMAASLAKAGVLRDLSAARLPQLNEVATNLFDDLSKLDGKRFGLPFEFTPTIMRINEPAFTSAGVKLPAADWTVQEFEAVVQGLKAAGQTVQITPSALLAPIIGAFGGQVYDPHSQRWLLDSEEAKQGLAYIARLVQDGLITADATGQRATGGGVIIGGNPGGGGLPGVPALMALPANVNIRTSAGVVFQQPYPRGPKGRSVPTSATMAVVPAASANGETAVDFVREMVSNEAAQMAMAKGGIRPVITSSKALAAWQDAVGDKAAHALEISLRGAHADLGVNYSEVLQTLTPYFQGKATLDQILPGLLAKLN